MADMKKSLATLFDDLAALNPPGGGKCPKRCGLWPRPSPRC